MFHYYISREHIRITPQTLVQLPAHIRCVRFDLLEVCYTGHEILLPIMVGLDRESVEWWSRTCRLFQQELSPSVDVGDATPTRSQLRINALPRPVTASTY